MYNRLSFFLKGEKNSDLVSRFSWLLPPTEAASAIKVLLKSLHEMGEEHVGEMFRLCQLRIVDVTPTSYDEDYVVILSHGEFTHCVDVDFVDDAGERSTLRLWKPFEKVIGARYAARSGLALLGA